MWVCIGCIQTAMFCPKFICLNNTSFCICSYLFINIIFFVSSRTECFWPYVQTHFQLCSFLMAEQNQILMSQNKRDIYWKWVYTSKTNHVLFQCCTSQLFVMAALNSYLLEIGHVILIFIPCLFTQCRKIRMGGCPHEVDTVVLWSTQRLSTFMSTQRISRRRYNIQHIDKRTMEK